MSFFLAFGCPVLEFGQVSTAVHDEGTHFCSLCRGKDTLKCGKKWSAVLHKSPLHREMASAV